MTRALCLVWLVACAPGPSTTPIGSAPGGTPSTPGTGTGTGGATGPGTTTDRIRVGTFNIDWLSPRINDRGDYTPRNEVDHAHIRSLIEETGFTVVGLQEIEGSAAIDRLGFDDRWDHVVGTSGWSQNLAVLYRADLVTVSDLEEIRLRGTDFPSKDPLVVTVDDGSDPFSLVVVHFNPYEDDDEAAYRYNQAEQLRLWLDDTHDPATEPVVVVGDFNDEFGGINTRYPSLDLLDDPPSWTFASHEADGTSNIPFDSLIDHVLLSEAAAARWEDGGGGCSVVLHDQLEPWASYTGGYSGRQNISSHRPVIIDLP